VPSKNFAFVPVGRPLASRSAGVSTLILGQELAHFAYAPLVEAIVNGSRLGAGEFDSVRSRLRERH
jgi:hypothetical protein